MLVLRHPLRGPGRVGGYRTATIRVAKADLVAYTKAAAVLCWVKEHGALQAARRMQLHSDAWWEPCGIVQMEVLRFGSSSPQLEAARTLLRKATAFGRRARRQRRRL